ncbi:hypothetical protein PTSG_05358 [Salpingoeca rosetta]|uniref:Uncharacterized protein n=1 Tax=Salpingoeca rosetta (strain ATCC 50818 / BSB-021) TaxID=946362 RepID=F2UA73_SALR5|nr:uncharacterized protein PTSG_05358 [Salpingoeca rosetta]EGD73648.1 hypothetical protein PTSG_05358 [Salpingoeca rosetta]|eukprot:XP_004993929.1 hypothetical protein PTSG_05358 [Salpingoeca rosetta]
MECWKLVAARILSATYPGDASGTLEVFDVKAKADCGRARTFLNLMLTCRELYHDLPWAMPKWCLATVLSQTNNDKYKRKLARVKMGQQPLDVHRGLSQQAEVIPGDDDAEDTWSKDYGPSVQDWLDTFQTTLLPPLLSPDEDKGGTDTEDDCTDSAARYAATVSAWMEERFLAYSWLGVTWASDLPFLQARLASIRHNDFWLKFSRCGRVAFTCMHDLETWAVAEGGEEPCWDEKDLREKGKNPREEKAHNDNDDDDDDDDECEEKQQHDDKRKQQQRRLHRQRHDDKRKQQQHRLHRQRHDDKRKQQQHRLHRQRHDDKRKQQQHRLQKRMTPREDAIRESQQQPRAALLYVTVTLKSQADADRFKEHYSTLVGDGHVRWFRVMYEQTALQGEVSNVHGLSLFGFNKLSDLSLFAGVQDLRVAVCRGMDLTPFTALKRLVFGGIVAGGQSVIADVDDVCLNSSSLVTSTLNAKRVCLRNMHLVDAPSPLHLPNATHIELRFDELDPDHNAAEDDFAVDLPPGLDKLVLVHGDTLGPELPRFEHAREADLQLCDVPDVAELAYLAHRVDKLVIRADPSDEFTATGLSQVPNTVYVCLDDVKCTKTTSLPPCVKELHAIVEDDVSVTCWSHIPLLSLTGWCMRASNMGALSGRRQLRMSGVVLDGEISDCDHVTLCDCHGSVVFSHITWLSVGPHRLRWGPDPRHTVAQCGANGDGDDDDGSGGGCGGDDDDDGSGGGSGSGHGSGDDDDDDDVNVDDDPGRGHAKVAGDSAKSERLLCIERVSDVSTCRLQLTSIMSFSCFHNVHRLILEDCTFDDLASLTSVTCLVIRDCTSNDKRWQWPNAVLVNRSPVEMMEVLTQGKRKRNT